MTPAHKMSMLELPRQRHPSADLQPSRVEGFFVCGILGNESRLVEVGCEQLRKKTDGEAQDDSQ